VGPRQSVIHTHTRATLTRIHQAKVVSRPDEATRITPPSVHIHRISDLCPPIHPRRLSYHVGAVGSVRTLAPARLSSLPFLPPLDTASMFSLMKSRFGCGLGWPAAPPKCCCDGTRAGVRGAGRSVRAGGCLGAGRLAFVAVVVRGLAGVMCLGRPGARTGDAGDFSAVSISCCRADSQGLFRSSGSERPTCPCSRMNAPLR